MKRSNNLPMTDDGRKCYPCCGFQKNQHKILYWENNAALKYYDNETQETIDEWHKWQDIYIMSSMFCIDGVMYFPYPEYNMVKEAIARYDMCH